MAMIAHLSDVHFGAHDPRIVDALEALLPALRPDLVVISGDFTQRARVEQYRMACGFVDRIEQAGLAVLAVPGNHDIPLYDVARRFARPLHRYRRYIDEELCPWFETDEIAVLGINTARSLTFKDGRISHEQMALIRERFREVSPGKTRILVTHHPLFAMPIGESEGLTKTVGRRGEALEAIGAAGVHLLLAGHFHHAYSRSAREMVETAGPELVIQAGTATSTRVRGDETQSFNWIDIPAPERVELTVFGWTGTGFERGRAVPFAFDGRLWRQESIPA
ncbi:MAG: metallophosphoesterase [Alphaproteobacteria bacterium]|nr:metallophosphoesterase [Alphaproteobacteria bacterium]